MRRFAFYLLVTLLAFGFGSFFAIKFYWVKSIDSVKNNVPPIQEEVTFGCPILLAEDYSEPNLTDDNISSTIITNADLHGAKLGEAEFSGAAITNSDFSKAELSKADFSNAKILYSSFIESNLSQANFVGALVNGSDLTGANLTSAKLLRASFAHSDLNNARLVGAKLKNVNFSDARLEKTIGLTYEQLENAVINEFTTLPPSLELQRNKLLQKSRKNLERLKQEMSKDDFESYFKSF